MRSSPRTRRQREAQLRVRYLSPVEATLVSCYHGKKRRSPASYLAVDLRGGGLRRALTTAEQRRPPSSSSRGGSARRRAPTSYCNNGVGDSPSERRPHRIRMAAGMCGLILLSRFPSLPRSSHLGAARREAKPSIESSCTAVIALHTFLTQAECSTRMRFGPIGIREAATSTSARQQSTNSHSRSESKQLLLLVARRMKLVPIRCSIFCLCLFAVPLTGWPSCHEWCCGSFLGSPYADLRWVNPMIF
ncbi:unnamed protein product [Urochloa humidicola]